MKTELLKISLIFIITSFVCISAFANNTNENSESAQGSTISGFIKDASDGEILIGANIYIPQLGIGATTNVYGFYSLTVLPGEYDVVISYIGYQRIIERINLNKTLSKSFELSYESEVLAEVIISDRKSNHNIVETQMSAIRINTETIKQIPALMGEVDLLKTVQLMPGVSSAGEGFSGFNVRGGSADQNLILLDEATVYNPSHLMGFFSVFNSDAIRDMTVYKGDIPAEYGGRLSSLLDIRMKDGNMKKFAGAGGLGTIASRLTLEGPIIKDKASFIVSGRRTYADMFLALASDSALHNNQLYFYDFNMKANAIINDKNRLFVSGYFGRDVFAFQDMVDMRWGNHTYTVRLNTVLNEKLFSNTSLIYSNYDYAINVSQDAGSFGNFVWDSNIRDIGLKYDLNYYMNPNNSIKFGVHAYYRTINPGTITSKDFDFSYDMENNTSLDYAFYASNNHKISNKLILNYGLRLSAFENLGEKTVYTYDDNFNISDTLKVAKGERYNTNFGLEPRLGATYIISDKMSVKSSYSRTRQYLHLASNSNAGLPTDVWFPVSPNVKPQISDQVAAGVFRNFNNDMFELSGEVYYKSMQNQIDFKDNAQLIFNEHIEAEIRTGIAKSYGFELMLRKQKGSFTGWIGYTLSKTQRKIEDINNHEWYNASFDKPHNLTIVMAYHLNENINIGATWIYSTGNPTTLPTGRWEYGGLIMPSYSGRNDYRLPDYHRLDLSVNFKLTKDPEKRVKHELNISCYNVYNRKNPFTIYFEPEEKGSHNMKAYQLSLFGIVPSITWNFKF